MGEDIDYRDQLVKDFERRMVPEFSEDEIEKISRVLMITLADYQVKREPRELSVLDDYNFRALKAYCGCLAIEGKSEKTIKAYRAQLERLGEVLNKNFDKMGTYDLRLYLAMLKNRGCNNTTIENTRAYFSAFFKWMEAEGLITKNPMASIKPIKTAPKVEEPFTDSEIDSLRLACKNVKERALIEVALSSGLRLSELAQLKITDIDLRKLEVKVRHGKGDKYRVSYISELAAKYVKKYLQDRADELDVLFLSQLGCSHYSGSGIYRLICKVGDRAGVGEVHPHRFRHTLASNLAEKGMPVNEIQQILGHSDINTTMRYVHTSRTTVQSSYRKFSG